MNVHEYEAGEASATPATETARTAKVLTPSLAVTAAGDVQAVYAAPFSEHWNVEPLRSVVNRKVPALLVTVAAGFEVSVVSGAG